MQLSLLVNNITQPRFIIRNVTSPNLSSLDYAIASLSILHSEFNAVRRLLYRVAQSHLSCSHLVIQGGAKSLKLFSFSYTGWCKVTEAVFIQLYRVAQSHLSCSNLVIRGGAKSLKLFSFSYTGGAKSLQLFSFSYTGLRKVT